MGDLHMKPANWGRLSFPFFRGRYTKTSIGWDVQRCGYVFGRICMYVCVSFTSVYCKITFRSPDVDSTLWYAGRASESTGQSRTLSSDQSQGHMGEKIKTRVVLLLLKCCPVSILCSWTNFYLLKMLEVFVLYCRSMKSIDDYKSTIAYHLIKIIPPCTIRRVWPNSVRP